MNNFRYKKIGENILEQKSFENESLDPKQFLK